jgi:hypothetical protein
MLKVSEHTKVRNWSTVQRKNETVSLRKSTLPPKGLRILSKWRRWESVGPRSRGQRNPALQRPNPPLKSAKGANVEIQAKAKTKSEV